jgi:hypothetical protein
MKLFQICILFIITQISINYKSFELKSNIIQYISDLSPSIDGYIYYLRSNSYDDNSYFEFQIELNKNDAKSFSLAFVSDSYISSSSSYPIKNQTITYSELNIQENGEKTIMKWSKTFPFTSNYLGLYISPNKQIGNIAIRLFSDCRANDLITIIVFAFFFGVCILLCVLTLVMTKACGSKDSNDIFINKNNSAGLVQNEIINASQA